MKEMLCMCVSLGLFLMFLVLILAARVLCIYMKRWLQLIGMKNDFNTYSINLMVIFYLQTLEHLPPIAKLFEDVNMETALVIGRK